MKKLKNFSIVLTPIVLFALFIYSFTKLPSVASSAGSGVVLNEIAWAGTTDTNDEWIELYNNSGSDVDLTGWTLIATDGTPSINLSGTISSEGYFLLERSDENTVKDIASDQIYTGALGNAGETLELRNSSAELEDSANANGGGWPAGTSSPSISMERIDTLLPDADDNWVSNNGIKINGTDVGDVPILGTPKSQNSVYGVTPSPTEEPNPTVSPTEGPTETPTESPVPTDEPTESPTPTTEPTEPPTPTVEPSPTLEPSPSDEPTPTEFPTPSPMKKVYWKLGFGQRSVICRPSYQVIRIGFLRLPIMGVSCN